MWKYHFFSCVEVINSKRQVNGKLGHVVQIQYYQHFQSPIQPGIKLAKNHFVDVLPSNHYLLTDFYLFIIEPKSTFKQFVNTIKIFALKGNSKNTTQTKLFMSYEYFNSCLCAF